MIAAIPAWNGPQLAGNWDVIRYYALQHLRYTVVALALGTALTAPLVYSAHRWPRSYPPMLVLANVAYAIPSIAMFLLLSPAFGFTNDRPIVVAMALYTLVVLLRNMVEGLRSVPPGVIDAATGMGYGRSRRFLSVDVPLALPGIIAGMRLASISTISLISVGGLIGRGGLGRMIDDGFRRQINVELWSSTIAVVVLAIAVDAVILLAGRLLTPWTRALPRGAR